MVNDDDAGLAFAQLQAVSAEQKTPGRTHDKLCELQPGDFDYDKIRSEHLSPDDHDAVPRDAIEHSAKGFDAPSPLSELPFDVWTRVLDFLPPLVMLRLFQACRAFCALNRGVRTIDFGGTHILESNALTVVRLIVGSPALVTLNLSRAEYKYFDPEICESCKAVSDCCTTGTAPLGKAIIKVSSALTALNLNHNDIGDTGAAALAEGLKVSSALKKLDLSNNSIKDEGASALGQGLKDNKALEELNLNSCHIGAAGAQGLAEGLFSSAVTNLNLAGNLLEDEGAKALAGTLGSSALKKLDLSYNRIKDEGASALGQGLKNNKTLQELNLISCLTGAAGAQWLAEGLSSSALKNLDLAYNRGIDGEPARQLAAAALGSKTLEVFSKVPIKKLREDKLIELKLSAEGLGLPTAIVLAELVKFGSALKKLVLNANSIGGTEAAALGTGLKENKSLKELELFDCQIDAAGAQGLAAGLFGSALTSLDLSINKISSTGAAALAEAVKFTSTLTSLDISENAIGPYGAEALAGAFGSSALTNLDLSFNRIGAPGAEALAGALKVSSALTSLNLHTNNIGLTGTIALAEALKVSSALTNLNLSRNNIGSYGATALAEALAVSFALKKLVLNANSIGDAGAAALGANLKKNKCLEELELIGCEIGAAAAQGLAEGLFSSVLKNLDLCYNKLCGLDRRGKGTYSDIGIRALAEALKISSTPKKLLINNNSIGDSGAAALGASLKKNKCLEELELRDCGIGAAGVQGLAEGLFSSALKKLDLSNNSIKDEGASALGQGLKDNKTLQELNLHFCHIGAAGAKGLAEGLFSSALINIDLSLNQIGPTGAAALAEALKVSSALKRLVLSRNMIGDEGATALGEGLEENKNDPL